MKTVLPMGLYPITKVQAFPGGYVKVIRKYAGKDVPCFGSRKAISEMTYRSKKRMVWKMLKTDVNWQTMTMLSYGQNFPKDGQVVKKHLNGWLNWARYETENDPQIVSRETFRYLWFLEFQERSAPHIHVITNLDFNHLRFDFFTYNAARKWADIIVPAGLNGWTIKENGQGWATDWGKVFRFHAHQNNWQPVRAKDGAVRYACKYAAKAEQKDVPEAFRNVGRFWGMSRNCPEKESAEIEITEQELREWLAVIGHPAEKWDIIPSNLYNMQT